MDDKGNHYLWGNNSEDCCLYNHIEPNLHHVPPHCINDIVLEKSGKDKIVDVFIGNDNTKIICE